MVRAAAKNHAHVGVVVDPADYDAVLDELRREGRVSPTTRRGAGPQGVRPHAAYDAAIVGVARPRRRVAMRGAAATLDARPRPSAGRCATARTRTRPGRATASRGTRSWWDDAVQHGGKELSYLNLYDTEAAWRLVHQLGDVRPR